MRVDPQYLQHCSPLVTLSVAAAVTVSLNTNSSQRLMWLEIVLDSMDVNVRPPKYCSHSPADAITGP